MDCSWWLRNDRSDMHEYGDQVTHRKSDQAQAAHTAFEIRDIRDSELAAFGEVLVEVYSALDGFPHPAEQPAYYQLLRDVGRLLERPGVQIFVAEDRQATLLGGVVFFADMAQYGSGGTATSETDAAGIRLLGVRPQARGLGVGKALTLACLERARALGRDKVVLHTTGAMQLAWAMYERLGFQRAPDLDFQQEALPVFGFRLTIGHAPPTADGASR